MMCDKAWFIRHTLDFVASLFVLLIVHHDTEGTEQRIRTHKEKKRGSLKIGSSFDLHAPIIYIVTL